MADVMIFGGLGVINAENHERFGDDLTGSENLDSSIYIHNAYTP